MNEQNVRNTKAIALLLEAIRRTIQAYPRDEDLSKAMDINRSTLWRHTKVTAEGVLQGVESLPGLAFVVLLTFVVYNRLGKSNDDIINAQRWMIELHEQASSALPKKEKQTTTEQSVVVQSSSPSIFMEVLATDVARRSVIPQRPTRRNALAIPPVKKNPRL
jgi:hypothetical protein